MSAIWTLPSRRALASCGTRSAWKKKRGKNISCQTKKKEEEKRKKQRKKKEERRKKKEKKNKKLPSISFASSLAPLNGRSRV